MGKNILIFSDGTGQIGGIRPDQRLSNVYKMYRAMRPGPDSPIRPTEQVAFYDPGLGAGETDGLTFRKTRNALASAVGTGIDENVIDCYEKIISYYEPGDNVLIFGFSRGAYTARSIANVMNLCGIPTQMPDGSAIPRYGPTLRKIAEDAVKYVYNHGAGIKRGDEPYYSQREEKGRRFRKKYQCAAEGEKALEQGNVQPHFIGVFDTVAALGIRKINWLVYSTLVILLVSLFFSFFSWPWYISVGLSAVAIAIAYWAAKIFISQFKYYSPNPERPLKFTNPTHWFSIWKNGHRAVWSNRNYDKYLDSDVKYARHALAIDEQRADFPRVKWGSLKEQKKTKGRRPIWLKQVWFAGCHSDIGGSYPEPESRLSDIALGWMIEELQKCVSGIQIRQDVLMVSGDPLGLQHEEKYLKAIGPFKIKWTEKPRFVPSGSALHPSVLKRLTAGVVPHAVEMKQYRPIQLKTHSKTSNYYL